MLHGLLLWAQENGGKAGGGGEPPPLFNLWPFLIIGGAFYFLLLRPSFRQEKERKALRSNVKKDDKVLLTSGIHGVIVSVSDDDVVVRVPPDNIKLKIVKAAIDRNFTNEEAAKSGGGTAAGSTAITKT